MQIGNVGALRIMAYVNVKAPFRCVRHKKYANVIWRRSKTDHMQNFASIDT